MNQGSPTICPCDDLRYGDVSQCKFIEATAIGLFRATAEGHLLCTNHVLAQTLGYDSNREMITEHNGQGFVANLLSENAERDNLLQQILSSETAIETPCRRKDGSLVNLRIVIKPVLGDSGNPSYLDGNILDVSYQKRLEQELQVTRREMEHMAYVASHDIQEPLRMITGFVQLLEQRYQGRLDQDADDFIGFIVDGAQRMKSMLDELLVYSRVDRKGSPLIPTDAGLALQQARQSLSTDLERCHAEVVAPETFPQVTADRVQLAQVFFHLLQNAIKYRGDSPLHIEISVRLAGPEWIFSVCDNGIGIPSEKIEEIFQLFRRLHNLQDIPGTGAGLALCKKIVNRHGGRIWAESKWGEGSTFFFTLPHDDVKNRRKSPRY